MADKLPDPPRLLPASETRAVLLGHPATLAGVLGLALASALVWLLVAAYGLGFSALRPLVQTRLSLPAVVESSEGVLLLTGEPAHRTTALFSYQGATYRAAAYGETTLTKAQSVNVVVPQASPEHAWIEGLQKFPLRLRGLATVAAIAFLPGSLLALWGLLAGLRQRRLLLHGQVVQAQRVRHLGLPRPLTDRFLDCFKLKDAAGKPRSVWSIGPDGPDECSVLISSERWSGAVVVDRLLPNVCYVEHTVRGTGAGRRVSAWAVMLLLLVQAGVLAIFLAT